MQVVIRTDVGADVLLEAPNAFRMEVEIDGLLIFGMDAEGPGLFRTDPEVEFTRVNEIQPLDG